MDHTVLISVVDQFGDINQAPILLAEPKMIEGSGLSGIGTSAPNMVIFKVSHFSLYMIGYNPVTFSDVSATFWGRDAIESAAARNLIQGVGDGRYQPERSVTRAEFVEMVANLLTLPEAKAGTAAYEDVTAVNWYYPAIMKARSAGLLDRFTEAAFAPNQAITREEMAVILAAAVNYKGIVTTMEHLDLSSKFTDYAEVNASFQNDLQTVVKLSLMQGIGDGSFSSQGVTTRAQAATVLTNLLNVL